MSVYKVVGLASDAHVYKALTLGGGWALVDPAPALALRTYGTGALGYGALNDPARQTALVIVLDILADDSAALSIIQAFAAAFPARWNSGSFISAETFTRWTLSSGNYLAGTVFVPGAFPDSADSSFEGPAVDLPAGSRRVYCQQIVGNGGGDGTLDGRVQESITGSDPWTDVGGAAFTQEPGPDGFQTIHFTPVQPHIRYAVTLAGDSPVFFVSVLFSWVP